MFRVPLTLQPLPSLNAQSSGRFAHFTALAHFQNLYKMAESLSEKYRVKGFETETVDVCALNFHRYIACMKCRSCGEPLRSLQVMPCPLF